MRFIIRLTAIFSLFIIFSGCEALQKATNTTGSAFSLTGQWELTGNNQESVALGIGSKVTVVPFISEGRVTVMAGTANCIRQNDVLWKAIAGKSTGGFIINNLVNGCNGLSYLPAIITVIDNNEIKVTGKNTAGLDMSQTWKRVK